MAPGSHDADGSMNLDVEAVGLPDGFSVNPDGTSTGPCPGMGSELVLRIDTSPLVKPGEYDLEFDVKIDNKDYGKLPCAIKVDG